jgi:DNA-binding response OmpR family regulator
MKTNVLIIEDEPQIREIIRKYAEIEQFDVYEAEDGKQAFELIEENDFSVIILDVMLPDTDGWMILRKIRTTSNTPVIMLTARAEEDDKLFGFELGADDYVTKPFSSKELMARVKSVLKRNHTVITGEITTIGIIDINMSFHQVKVSGAEVNLTPIEFDLLTYFANNRNNAINREQILNSVWGYDYFGDIRTVDTHVKRLRKKLGEAGAYIKTVRGLGYRLVVPNE